MISTFITFLILTFSIETSHRSNEDICLSKNETNLLEQINAARQEKGLKEVAISSSLTKVAKLHARDLMVNKPFNDTCNPHSWSDQGDWEACCYTDDHSNAECMWKKPSELTNYRSDGYEIVAFWQSGEDLHQEISAAKALQMWVQSPGHSRVIFNQKTFGKVEWRAIGVAINGNYASVWFGEEEDAAFQPQICQE